MRKIKLMALIIAAMLLFTAIGFTGCLSDSGEYSAPEETSDYSSVETQSSAVEKLYGKSISEGDKTDGSFTLMVYICASNLETDDGSATNDINEILYGEIGDKLNIIIQTGGANKWQNTVISADHTQRYKATNDGLELLWESEKPLSMTSGDTLGDFIRYSKENYPAERYGLVMWDHGFGAVGGLGPDEIFPDDRLHIQDLDTALANSGTKFAFIGFDACLMGTIEYMITCSHYADYYIASENVEPGCGWYYTDWISCLGNDPTISINTLGKQICDDTIEVCKEVDPTNHSTLATYDLSYVREELTPAFNEFIGSCETEISSGNFNLISQPRGKATDIYSGTDHIDLLNYLNEIKTAQASALAEKLGKSMVYYCQSKSNGQYNGISFYLPFYDVSGIDTILAADNQIDFCDNYSSFLRRYANMLAAGHNPGNTDSISASYADTSSYDYLIYYDWYEPDYQNGLPEGSVASFSDEIKLTDMGDYYAVSLTPDDWDLITDTELCLFGYHDNTLIEFGNDITNSFDENGNLMVDFNYNWVALNGLVVPFYTEYVDNTNGNFCTEGFVPAVINGKQYDIILKWNSEYPSGTVAGARPSGDITASTKGLIPIKDGDKITVMSYTASIDGNDDMKLVEYSEEFTVNGELTVSYETVDMDNEYLIYVMLVDIYNNRYFSEPIVGY